MAALDRYLNFDEEELVFGLSSRLDQALEENIIRFGLVVPKEEAWRRIRSRDRKAERAMKHPTFLENYFLSLQFAHNFCHFVIQLDGPDFPDPSTIAESIVCVVSRLRGFQAPMPIPHWMRRTKLGLPTKDTLGKI